MCIFGTNGPMRTAIWVPYTARSGVAGRRPRPMIRTVPSIRSAMCLILSRITRILVVWSCPLGILPKWRIGVAAMPRALPVLRGGWQTFVPAISAFLRHVPRRTVQYRILFAVDVDDRSAGGTAAGGVRVDGWRLPRVRQSHRPGVGAVDDYSDFEIVGYQHHPTIKAPVAV